MSVLLNGVFNQEGFDAEVQVVVLGASREQVIEVVESAQMALEEGSSLSPQELVAVVRGAGYEVLELPVVVYSPYNGIE